MLFSYYFGAMTDSPIKLHVEIVIKDEYISDNEKKSSVLHNCSPDPAPVQHYRSRDM
jgi:hypothetical protein